MNDSILNDEYQLAIRQGDRVFFTTDDIEYGDKDTLELGQYMPYLQI